MTYQTLTDRFLSGRIDAVALFDGLRALGYSWAEAEEHTSIMKDVRADRALAAELGAWADEHSMQGVAP